LKLRTLEKIRKILSKRVQVYNFTSEEFTIVCSQPKDGRLKVDRTMRTLITLYLSESKND